MNFLLLLLQTADAPSSWPWYVKLLVTLLALFMAALGFYLGRLWTNLRYRREKRDRESAMFNLEKSLADFFEHEKSKLIKEKIALEREVERLEKRVEEFRKKAVGGSKFGKDARTDMLMSLLMENEDLQEKLFEEHARQKEERDRHLNQELSNLTHQKVLLSHLLQEKNVHEAVIEVLEDDSKVRRLQAKAPRLPAPRQNKD